MLSALICSRFKPDYIGGLQKQFALFCCVFFSVFSAALFLSNENAGGCVVIVGLGVATGMEELIDFCVGCFAFGIMMRLGLVSKGVYRPYINFSNYRRWAWDYTFDKTNYPQVKAERYMLPGQTEPTKVDLMRKVRLDTEYKLRDFSLIRHMRVEMFGFPLTIATLAFAYFYANKYIPDTNTWKVIAVYHTLAIFSAVVFCMFIALYLIKMIIYPKKVAKEWQNPVFGNFFSALPITTILLGLMFLPNNRDGGGTLIWIGSILQMIITVFRLSDLVYDRVAEDLVNPSLMMAPVGNYAAAIGFSLYYEAGYISQIGEMDYTSFARLWFGVASLFALVLFTITFRKAMHDHHSDNRLRPTLWIWLATSAIAGPAFLAVSDNDLSVARGVVYQSLWGISLLFFSMNGLGFYRYFFSYVQDMSIWLMPFSLTSASTAVCLLHTSVWLLDMSLFKPRMKCGPMNFLKITHEAFRFSIPKYENILEALKATDTVAITSASHLICCATSGVTGPRAASLSSSETIHAEYER
eukprot:gene15306-20628_t